MEATLLIAEGSGIRVHSIDAGTLRVDGGAMFGPVPKPLWSRHVEPDERNRIPLALRCLLIETATDRILVDAGVGRIDDDHLRALYGVENEGDPTRLETSLRAAGVEPEDISVVVSTHLHFDHAGGLTRDEEGARRPSFPGARHVIRRGEWETAKSDHPLLRESYDASALEVLAQTAALELIDEDLELMPGVRLVSMPGHTKYHQGVLVDLGDRQVCYPCDLVPTTAHIRLTWVMAYDVEPIVTVSEKQRWLTHAAEAGWLIVFAHDHEVAVARAVPPLHGAGCELTDPVRDTDRTSERSRRQT